MRRGAFTLIELLVVVAIIALLIGIMVPSLTHARAMAKLTVCGNNLRQIGVGIATYANANNGEVPYGPPGDTSFADPNKPGANIPFSQFATNQVWLGVDPTLPASGPSKKYVGIGLLLPGKSATAPVFYCPADQTEDETDDQAKIGTDQNAYGSYLYRQLDAVPAKNMRGRLGDLGVNQCQWPDGHKTQVQVQALALDVSTFGQGTMQHITHDGLKMNVLYQDTSVRPQDNPTVKETGVPPRATPQELPDDRIFSLYMDRALGPGNYLVKRIDDILIRADFSYQLEPKNAPQLP